MIRWTILEASYTPTLGVISCSLHLDCVEKVSKLSSQQQPYYYYRACSWELVDLKSNHDIWRPVRTLQWLSRCGDRTLDEALCRRRLTHNVMGWHSFWGSFLTLSPCLMRIQLEPVCLRNGKKSPNQETGLGNRGHMKVLNDTKLVLNEHEWHA